VIICVEHFTIIYSKDMKHLQDINLFLVINLIGHYMNKNERTANTIVIKKNISNSFFFF
jgi:hypothetical protein